MKTLNHYYKHKQDFSLFHREGHLAIFKGISRATGRENWEVIEIQSHNGLQMGSNWVEAKEFPPSDEQFGVKGWTAFNEQDAWRIFNNKKQDNE